MQIQLYSYVAAQSVYVFMCSASIRLHSAMQQVRRYQQATGSDCYNLCAFADGYIYMLLHKPRTVLSLSHVHVGIVYRKGKKNAEAFYECVCFWYMLFTTLDCINWHLNNLAFSSLLLFAHVPSSPIRSQLFFSVQFSWCCDVFNCAHDFLLCS